MPSSPVLVLCDEPDTCDRLLPLVADAGGLPTADPDDALAAVWASGATPGGDLAMVAVGDRDLGGLVELMLGDERIAAAIDRAALDWALVPALARLLEQTPFLDGAELSETEIDDYAGRQRALEAVDRLAAEHHVRRSVRDRVATACEELLMNALYDAPVDDSGALVFGDVEPAERVSMKSPRPVTLRYGVAGDRLSLSVTDRFGRLTRETVLETLDKCMSSADPIDRKKLGSGLGLYMACNAAAGLVVDVAPGETTRVIASFGPRPAPLGLLGFYSKT